MKPCTLFLAALAALTLPAVVRADTVYYKQTGSNGIASVTGTITQETARFLEVVTADGRTVPIPRPDVYQIVRDLPKPAGQAPTTEPGTAAAQPVENGTTPAVREEPSYTTYATMAREPRSTSMRVHHYGFKGGMNISNMSVDPQEFEDDDSLKSFALGAWWGTPINRRVSLQAEALYSVKGDSESDGGYTTTTQMKYIDVPVLARLGFMNGSGAQPSLFLGPSLALNLSAHSKLEGAGSDFDEDVKDQTRKVDLGLVLGGGVDFPVGKHTYGVELRYSKGLTNAVGDAANGDAHNNVLAVMGSVQLQ